MKIQDVIRSRLCTYPGMLTALVAGCLLTSLARGQAAPGAARVRQLLTESGFRGGLVVHIGAQEGGLAAARAEQLLAESGFRGGLIVHVGVQQGSLTAALGARANALVHGLVRDATTLETARRQIRDAGGYGRVSVTGWRGGRLPYAEGTVNLLLVLDEGTQLDQAEISRVLAPLGVARVRRNGALTTFRKPWPTDVDEWSHSRYDATGNAVSSDERAGPPQSLQWAAWPRWNRGTKTSSLVSTRGRIFYVLNDGHFAASANTWSLIARDAHNGIQLWRHELPSWAGAKGGKKIGPAQVHRRLVAEGDRVYATLGEAAPVSVLDAATGDVIRVLHDTGQTQEFILSAGVVVALVDPGTAAAARRGQDSSVRLVAVDAATGKVLWQHASKTILPLAVAADGKQVVFHDGTVLRSLNLHTGSPHWASAPTGQKVVSKSKAHPDSPGAEKGAIWLAPQFAPTLVLYKDVVAFAGGRQLNVVSAEDGRELWRTEYAPSNYSVPVDLFGFNGCLWGPDTTMNMWRPVNDSLDYNAYDPLTGQLERSAKGKYGFKFQHHRCHQMKVIGSTVVAGKAGIEFLDTATGNVAAHHWMRGSCFFGVMPANGLLYVPPHNCACYVRAKLSGFMAFNAARPTPPVEIPDAQRLQRGPAYGQTAAGAPELRPDDWPTYRHDASRSGRSPTKVNADLLLGWETDLGGKLTSPVIASGRVFVAATDRHLLHAIEADTGSIAWQYAFDARVDSPPTVYQGLVLAGCRDGSVHALRASDGALVWRFLAAPEERLIVSLGQLESVWPVHGSVLVLNDTLFFAAGRSSYLDGGVRLYGLEPHTGRQVVERVLWTRQPDGAQTLDEQSVDGYRNDILSSDGERVFMRHQAFDRSGKPTPGRITHLHSPDGYLSSDTTSRLLWTYAPLFTSPHQGAFYDLRLSRALFPSGRILVEGEDVIYGFGQNHYEKMRTDPGGAWAVFAAAKKNDVPVDLTAREYRALALSDKRSVAFHWHKRVPIQAWAMVKTDDVLFVAGPRGSAFTSQEALDGKAAGVLLAMSPSDGEILAEMPLPSMPVWDGMAAADGNLTIALANGRTVCLWGAAPGRAGTPLSAAGWRAVLPPVKVAAEEGLLGRWRFDEGRGMLARDCSGRGHDADVYGNWASGEFGNCLVAAGTPQAVVIPDAEHLQFGTSDFTLALWVKVDEYDARLLGKEAFPENWWVINLLENGQAELVLGESRGHGMQVRPKTATHLATDAWTHLVAVADREGREVRLYMNGKLESRQAIPETMNKGLNAAGRDIAIPSSHKPFKGLISDFRLYGRALSAERVKELYEEEAPRRTSAAFKVRE